MNTTPIPMTLDVVWLANVLTGFFLPWIIAKIQSSQATRQYRSLFAFAACLVVGFLITFMGKQWIGAWGAYWYDNAILVLWNVGTLLLTAWQSYARLWTDLPAFQKVNNDPGGVGKP